MLWKRIRRKKSILGFTLTEITAVAAIVTSIPTGAYLRAKQMGYQTECKNNLLQIGQAIVMYQMSYGHYPKAVFYPEDALGDERSIVRILESSGSGLPKEMWTCPAAPDALKERVLTFVYNDTFGGRKSLPQPDKAWLLIELNCVSKKVPPPHPQGYNILFADGHVLTSKQLPPSITAKQRAAIDDVYQRIIDENWQKM